MLVLTRKTGQKLIIDDNIEIFILETRGESVKIGIKAPKNIAIYREEIYQEIKKANQQSSKNVLLSDLNIASTLFKTNKPAEESFFAKFNPLLNKIDNKNISEK